VQKLVVIDLSAADVSLFEQYEKGVIPLLSRYGGTMAFGVRSADGMTEMHLLSFADTSSFENFLADPDRAEWQDKWKLTGARATVTTVTDIDYL